MHSYLTNLRCFQGLGGSATHGTMCPAGLVSLFPGSVHSLLPAVSSSRPCTGQRPVVVAGTSRHVVASAAALAERVEAEADQQQQQHQQQTLQSIFSESRRRSLEASYDAEASEEPHLPLDSGLQQAHTSASDSEADSLERSWANLNTPQPSNSQPEQPVKRRRGRPRKSPIIGSITASPYKQQGSRRLGRNIVLNSRLKVASAASLAARRAARRTTDQGRIEAEAADTAVSGRRSPTEKLGPAEAFLTFLGQRLEDARSAESSSPKKDAVSWYLHNVGNAHILTRDEEVKLGAIIHLGSSVSAAQAQLAEQLQRQPTMGEVARHLQLKSEATVRQRLDNAAAAKELLMQYNVKLVISVARQYKDRGVEFSDLLPVGVTGLTRAIDRYDASKGFRFSTYAHWWIRQAISRCVQDQARVVRLPANVYELLNKINKVARRLNVQPNRQKPATYKEIASALDIPVQKVIQVVRAARDVKSLDTPVDQHGNSNGAESPALVDTVAADTGDQQETATDRIVKEKVDEALKGLDLRPRNILRYRYGLHGALGRALTLNEVGELYGLKGERVRQIEGLAMSTLKKGLRNSMAADLRGRE